MSRQSSVTTKLSRRTNWVKPMLKYRVTRIADEVEVLLLPHKDGGGWSYVNLTKGHICPCRFRSVEEALEDMHKQRNVVYVKEPGELRTAT